MSTIDPCPRCVDNRRKWTRPPTRTYWTPPSIPRGARHSGADRARPDESRAGRRRGADRRRGQARTYVAEIKRGLRPATLGAVLHQLQRREKPGLLVADYLTPPMTETLKAQEIAFLDATGNAYLDQPPLYVWVTGQRPAVRPAAGAPATRAFRTGGLKVIFALLCHPEWVDDPYRTIAERACVAHGTVGWVMTDLQQLGFVADVKGRRRLLQGERLLKQWSEAYARNCAQSSR